MLQFTQSDPGCSLHYSLNFEEVNILFIIMFRFALTASLLLLTYSGLWITGNRNAYYPLVRSKYNLVINLVFIRIETGEP